MEKLRFGFAMKVSQVLERALVGRHRGKVLMPGFWSICPMRKG